MYIRFNITYKITSLESSKFRTSIRPIPHPTHLPTYPIGLFTSVLIRTHIVSRFQRVCETKEETQSLYFVP